LAILFLSNMSHTTKQLIVQITIATLGRLIINTARRFIYPFAAILSAGLGVELLAITSLIALNQATGLLSPIFGPLSDRWGYRAMMLLGLGLVALGMLAMGIAPIYPVLVVAMFLGGLGKSIYDPALHAYAGDRVPYERRGLAIGAIELSWAGSTLITLPLIGFMIERSNDGWQTPFLVLGIGAVLFFITLAWVIPPTSKRTETSHNTLNIWQAWKGLLQQPVAVGMLLFGFFLNMGNDMLFVVYGVWLQQDFALTAATIGLATMVIGVAELAGESCTVFFADRIGLRRAMIGGLVLSSLAYLLLPFIGQTLTMALVGLFLIFICIEFTIVTSFSICTELLPLARATMLSAYVAAAGFGRVIGALFAEPVWSFGQTTAWGSLGTTMTISTICNLIALGCIVWSIKLKQQHIQSPCTNP